MAQDHVEQLGQKLTASDYTALLSSLHQTALVSMTDARGTIVYANQKFVEVSKYSLNELIGQNHRILKSGHQPDSLFRELWGTIARGKVWRGEIKNRAKDGSYYWVDTSIAPILGKNGKPERYISVRFLITDKKQHEMLLEEARVKDEAILNSIGDGVIATDAKGCIVLINPKAEEILGWPTNKMIGQPLTKILPIYNEHGEALLTRDRPITKALTTQTSIHSTSLFYERRDKTKFPVAITMAPIMIKDKVIGAIDIFRDITEEKRIEQSKDEFISISSHQLRTPATGVKQYLGMVLEGYAGEITPYQHELLKNAFDSNERQLKIVNDLLRVAHVDAGQVKLSCQATDVNQLLAKISRDLASRFKEKQQTLAYKAHTQKVITHLDPVAMHMVIENLLDNASKYSAPATTITLTVKTVAEQVIIKVSDQGVGIKTADIDKIFKKFSRIDNAFSTTSGGTGLGLYWAHKMIHLHDGRLEVKSKPDQGSSFIIYLPLRA